MAQSNEQIDNPYKLLDPIIGQWITEGYTAKDTQNPALQVVASDIYEWGPGRKFIIHYAYGRIGNTTAGGIEIIRYDQADRKFKTFFINSDGNVIEEELIIDGKHWIWVGENVRCKGTWSDDGKSLTALHEKSHDGKNWAPAIDITLKKVD